MGVIVLITKEVIMPIFVQLMVAFIKRKLIEGIIETVTEKPQEVKDEKE